MNSPETYGRTLQAGYGIDGISLQELLGMTEVIPFLQRSLGIEAAQDAFKRLLDQDWEEELLKTHPHLSKEALSSLSVEESANCLIKAFEELLDPLPLDQRCIEFSELSTTNATKCDFYRHISAHSTERLTGTLTLLTHYPQLSHVFSMGKNAIDFLNSRTDRSLSLPQEDQTLFSLSFLGTAASRTTPTNEPFRRRRFQYSFCRHLIDQSL
jgi:hypothetical protein